MKKIVVTGCAGFIGHKVAEKLLDQGCEVLGLDNLNDYYDVRVKQWRLSNLQKKDKFIFKAADICDLPLMKELLGDFKPEAIINLAARAGVRASVADPFIYLETNTKGTLNLLECCKELKIKKFLLASTSSVYGLDEIPFSESNACNKPLSPYAATKKGAEAMCHTYHYLYGLDVVIPRFFTVYGPAGRPDMSIFIFIDRIMKGLPLPLFGDGSQKRDFTYVDDIAEGVIKSLQLTGYNTINLGGDHPVEINYIIKLIEEVLGNKAVIETSPRHAADIMATWADISQAKKLMSWQPTVSIEDGIARTIAWFKENFSWLKDIKLRAKISNDN